MTEEGDSNHLLHPKLSNRKKWYIAWGVASAVTLLFCYNVRPFVGYTDEFAILLNSINVISYSMGVGLPFFLAAGISVSSSSARRQAQQMYRSGISPFRVFLRRLGEAYILAAVFVVLSTIVLFIEPTITGTTFYSPMGTGYLIYLPAVLLSSLAISLILTSVGIFFAVLTDDVILSTSIGCATTIYLATLIGWAPTNLWASLTRSIAVFSPHNLTKAIAVILTDYEHPYGNSLASMIGFEPSFESILVSLLFFIGIAFLCGVVSAKILHHNSSYWHIRSDMTDRNDVWTSTLEEHVDGTIERNKQELRIRRVALIITVGFLIITLSLGTTSYQTAVREETTIIFHQSSNNGEQIRLGEWYVFPCNVQPISYDQFNYLHHDCHLVEWGSAPSEVTYYYRMLNMSSDMFAELNETTRRDLCSSRNRTQGNWGGMGGSWNLGYDYGSYTYVLKIVAAQNETLSGAMIFSIRLYQSAGW